MSDSYVYALNLLTISLREYARWQATESMGGNETKFVLQSALLLGIRTMYNII